MTSPYDNRTENTRNLIIGDRYSHYENKYYLSANGKFHYYINRKGYIHIVKPCRIRYDGEFSHYEISNYLLTPEDTIRETKCGGYYKTREECIAAIEENLAKDA